MRKIVIAGNWKMNKDARETEEFCVELGLCLSQRKLDGVLPIIAPVFPFLARAGEILAGIPVRVAAQDVSPYAAGAYTGEVAAAQLRSLGLDYCIIGHSERRQYHAENDTLIGVKLLRLREQGIIPILCLGETLQQRENDETEEVILRQLAGCLAQAELQTGGELMIAYEPVWAIGTGRTATADQAQAAHALIRNWLRDKYGQASSENIHILYGGSVKPDNIRELLAQPDIDGGLIGGASLQIRDYCAMLDTALEMAGVEQENCTR
ncbi:MAG TPA: triose-phosphate isomerase [Candidatus Syntrophosphaera sp.]|nr:triose-phosphate isomerase [Candidatus Syntrophosphaera sp.]